MRRSNHRRHRLSILIEGLVLIIGFVLLLHVKL